MIKKTEPRFEFSCGWMDTEKVTSKEKANLKFHFSCEWIDADKVYSKYKEKANFISVVDGWLQTRFTQNRSHVCYTVEI